MAQQTSEDMLFAELIRARLAERSVGVRELARLAGIDASFLSKVLAGKRSPPAEEGVLRRIAEVLELDSTRVIVAAGRIPLEWNQLRRDERLLREVHTLATARPVGAKIEPRGQVNALSPRAITPSVNSWTALRGRPRPVVRAGQRLFGDELL